MHPITLNPAALPTPPTYSHGFAVPAGMKTIYTAGQVGVDKSGQAAEGVAAQTELAFKAIRAILQEGGLDLHNVVKAVVYLLDPADYPEFVRVRTAMMGETKAASTLVYVSALVKPEWRVEIEVVAVG